MFREILSSVHKPSAPFSWVGRTFNEISLSAYQQISINLQAVFWRSGIYDLGRLRVLASISSCAPTLQLPTTSSFIIINSSINN